MSCMCAKLRECTSFVYLLWCASVGAALVVLGHLLMMCECVFVVDEFIVLNRMGVCTCQCLDP